MVYVLLADGFEEIEAISPVDILKRANIPVLTVALKDKTVTGAHSVKVSADIGIDDIKKEDMEMLVLPGGAGFTNLDNDKRVESLIDYAINNNIYVASICAAPSILGKRGYLQNKKATCFPGFEEELKGAIKVCDKVVCDGKIITAKGAGVALEFGYTLVEKLINKEKSEELKKVMQYI